MAQDETSTPVSGVFEVIVEVPVHVTLEPSRVCRDSVMATRRAANVALLEVNRALYFPAESISYGELKTKSVYRDGTLCPEPEPC